jgi:hypothetical protein
MPDYATNWKLNLLVEALNAEVANLERLIKSNEESLAEYPHAYAAATLRTEVSAYKYARLRLQSILNNV